MENKKKNSSFNEHKDIEAISYCFKCQTFLCNKCTNYHKGLFEKHPLNNLDKIKGETFTGFCQEENHNVKLDYYCKIHNKLCCAFCICKIKGNGNGQHNDCDICFINDIKEEKKSKLKDNIKSLEELSNKLDESIKNLKIIFEKIIEDKEKIKIDIQKIFTKLRTELNNREDKLLSEVDNYFDNNYCSEDILKKLDKLPTKIKTSLEKGKSIENEWDDNDKLNNLIYDCINIENNLKDINLINNSLIKYNFNENNMINCKFNGNVDKFVTQIKNFGSLSNFSFLQNFDSLILNNSNDNLKYFNLLDKNIKISKLNLIYRSSRDELNYLSIVNKINNKSNLIFLFLTGSDRIFGAFIKTKLENIDLKGSRKYYRDEEAFSFSLNNNKIYKILIPEYAIAFDKYNYILIGNNGNRNGFFISGNGNTIYDNDLINVIKIYDFSEKLELTEGNDNLKELEIFEVNTSI